MSVFSKSSLSLPFILERIDYGFPEYRQDDGMAHHPLHCQFYGGNVLLVLCL